MASARGIRCRKMRGIIPILFLILAACSATQWQRFKAHGAATSTGAVGGAGGVAVGGPIGAAVVVTFILLGMVIDATLEPPPTVKRVTTVVQVPTPADDGTPRKPVVHSYVDDAQEKNPNGVELPGVGDSPRPATFTERLWRALAIAWWVVVFLVVAGWLVIHPKTWPALWCVVTAPVRLVVWLLARARAGSAGGRGGRLPRPPSDPPGAP